MEKERTVVCHEILSAADAVFNGESPMESLNYVLAVLLWKSASDLWEDRQAFWSNRFAGDLRKVERRMKWERFQIPKGCQLKDQWAFLGTNNLGERLNRVMGQIEQANAPILTGLLSEIDFSCERRLGSLRDRNSRLRRLLEGFNHPDIDFRPSRSRREEMLSQVVGFLLDQFGARLGSRAGEFLTPPGVCQLLAKLLAPQKGDSIYDPTCGAGSLLMGLVQEANDVGCSLFGQEKNGVMLTLCRLSILLHGVDTFRAYQGDSLRDPQWLSGGDLKRFDVVVGHPPFSLSDWGHDSAGTDRFNRFSWGLPPKSKGDFAFILHMIQSAKKGKGRVGVIASRGVLFRKGIEASLRQRLVEENVLDAVVMLPAKALGGTTAPGVILILKRQRKLRDVLLIDASSEVDLIGGQTLFSSRAMNRIVSIYKNRIELEGFSCRLSPERIAVKEYSLEWDDYLRTAGEPEAIDRECIREQIEFVESELNEVRGQIELQLQALSQISSE